MPKQHQQIAVTDDLKNFFQGIGEESIKVYSSKPDLFQGTVRTITALDTARSIELNGQTFKELQTTVPDRWAYTLAALEKTLNNIASVDTTNATAKADIIIGSVTILKDVPVTTLLALERYCKQLRSIVQPMPTLKPGVAWIPDPNRGKYVFTTKHAAKSHKTEKTVEIIIAVQATDKFPAQIEKIPRDKNIANVEDIEFSGCVSSADKQSLLERITLLEAAVKEARTRANDCEATPLIIGPAISKYLQFDAPAEEVVS